MDLFPSIRLSYLYNEHGGYFYIGRYEGESKSKGKIHLTAVTEVTVSNFTYHFST